MKTVATLFLLLTMSALRGQPNTEVYLFDLVATEETFQLDNPRNISNNPGYDNQPAFLLDGSAVMFSSSRNQQTDILKYDLTTGTKNWITRTEGSEYSPTPRPDKRNISAILLERDGRQLLWSYSLEGTDSKVLVPYVKIGYHTWLNENTLFAFVLGPHSTLQMINLKNQRTETIVENIGRSLHKIPGQEIISFVDKKDSTWMIRSYHPGKAQFTDLVPTPAGSEDMVWLNDGSIIMGEGSTLIRWKEDGGRTWTVVADLQDHGLTGITRLAVNPDETLMAIVVTE